MHHRRDGGALSRRFGAPEAGTPIHFEMEAGQGNRERQLCKTQMSHLEADLFEKIWSSRPILVPLQPLRQHFYSAVAVST